MADEAPLVTVLMQQALIIQGCFVVKSELLYTEKYTSAHAHTEWPALRAGRDWLVRPPANHFYMNISKESEF